MMAALHIDIVAEVPSLTSPVNLDAAGSPHMPQSIMVSTMTKTNQEAPQRLANPNPHLYIQRCTP